MWVVIDARHRVVAAFSHWSDCAQFLEEHRMRGFESRDVPELMAMVVSLLDPISEKMLM